MEDHGVVHIQRDFLKEPDEIDQVIAQSLQEFEQGIQVARAGRGAGASMPTVCEACGAVGVLSYHEMVSGSTFNEDSPTRTYFVLHADARSCSLVLASAPARFTSPCCPSHGVLLSR